MLDIFQVLRHKVRRLLGALRSDSIVCEVKGLNLDALYGLKNAVRPGLVLTDQQAKDLSRIVNLFLAINDDAEELQGDLQDWVAANKSGPNVRVVRLPSGWYAFAGCNTCGWGYRTAHAARAASQPNPSNEYESGAD